MGSSGKKKTTMAKLARENRLRERRLDKEARKEARKQASADQRESHEAAPDAADAPSPDLAPGPADPRAKEVALDRLRDSSDEELAVFGGTLRDDALEAGATEQELRDAQRDHLEHGV